ncbi:MAG: glycosyltransferase family protein [Desulfitobacteriaceae bacterium]
MGKDFPRVLVVSHNVFSTTSNMGKTLLAFFNEWDSDKIAQLYLHSEIPDTDICKRYYRVTDFDMIGAIIKGKKTGTILTAADVIKDRASTRIDSGLKKSLYNTGLKRKPYMYIIRNAIWSFNKWKTPELFGWIDKFKPQVMFYAAGSFVYSMRIAMYIQEKYKLPMIVFFGDDYYFLDLPQFSLFDVINKEIFKNTFKKLFSNLSSFIAASDKMYTKYKYTFDKNGCAILTSTPKNTTKMVQNRPLKVSYIGNLFFDRWKALIEIGKYLKNMGVILDVYSNETRESIIKELNRDNGIQFHGPVPSSKVKEIIADSTIIVHVEAMDTINTKKVEYSMSTKIAESLASGVCLFAYGPRNVSSIEYLKDNEAAFVVTDKNELQDALHIIINDKVLRNRYIHNALKLAEKRHDYDTNTVIFYNLVVDACKGRLSYESTSS